MSHEVFLTSVHCSQSFFWRDTGFAPFTAHLQPGSEENQLPNPIWKLGPGSVRSVPEMRIIHQIFIPLFTIWPWSCSLFCWMYWLAAEIHPVMQKSVGVGTWILHSHQFRHFKKLQEAVESTVWIHTFASRFLIQFEIQFVNVVLYFCVCSTRFTPPARSGTKHSISVWSSFLGNHNFFFFLECRWALPTWSTYALLQQVKALYVVEDSPLFC